MKILFLLVWMAAAARAGAADEKPFIVWNNPPPKPQEFLTHHTYQSAVMKTEVGYNLYLPPGYEAPENTNRYPVIYWCHGMNCHESIDQFPARLVEQAIRERRIPPLIVVYVSGGSQSFYCDSPDLRWASETTITTELIPHIDAAYRTLASRDYRAIQGMSMGGFGSMRLALKHPELFSSVVAFAGGYVSLERLLEKERSVHFSNMFDGNSERFRTNHPFALAQQNADQVRGRVGIKLLVGSEDVLLEANRKMHAVLDGAGLPHEYDEVPGIKHDLRRLSEWIGSDGLEFAVKHFASSTAKDNDGPWVNPPSAEEKEDSTEHHIFYSELMHRPVGYSVYLPPGYYGDGAGHGLSTNTTRYPVIYNFHSGSGTESKTLYMARTLDTAIRAGRLPPMIRVWVYGGRSSWYADYADGSVMAESMIAKELIPHIDGRWRTIADRAHRAAQGFSMGDHGMMHMALKYPDAFSSVVSLMGGYIILNPETGPLPDAALALLRKIYGDLDKCEANLIWTMAPKQIADLKSLAIRIVVGDQDQGLRANRRLHELLTKLDVPHEYEEIPGVPHESRRMWFAEGEKACAFNAAHFTPAAR